MSNVLFHRLSFNFFVLIVYQPSWFCDTMWPLRWVCLCVSTGQTISLSVLARNPNKGLELEISRQTRSGRGEEGSREDTGSIDEGRRREAVDKDGRGERSALSWLSREWHHQQEPALFLAFVEVSRKIPVCDSLQMHRECKVPHTLSFLRLELTEVHVVRLFFLPPPWMYFVWPLWNVEYHWLEMKKKNY